MIRVWFDVAIDIDNVGVNLPDIWDAEDRAMERMGEICTQHNLPPVWTMLDETEVLEDE